MPFDMRSIPAAALITAGTRGNAATVYATPIAATGSRFGMTSTASGDTYALGDLWEFNSEL